MAGLGLRRELLPERRRLRIRASGESPCGSSPPDMWPRACS